MVVAVLSTALVVVGFGTRAGGAGVRYRDLVFSHITTTKDVPYGSSVNVDGVVQQHLLDVHEPAGDTAASRAAVVWVHGGFFIEGSKESYQTAWTQFAQAGFVTFSINYRLRPDLPRGYQEIILNNAVPATLAATVDAQHDAQAAVRFVRANAARYRVNPNRIVIAGHSAGGITAQRVLFNDHDPGTSGNPGYSSRVAAAVSMAGGSVPVLLAKVDPGEPPLQVIHGLVDDVVPFVAGPPSCAVSAALLNVCELVVDPDQDHGTFGYTQAREFLWRHLFAPTRLVPVPKVSVVGAG